MALMCWPTAAQAMDGDGNGKLDTAEFRAAMSQLGDNLSGDSVGTIFEAMGIYGFITLDQFLDIAQVCLQTLDPQSAAHLVTAVCACMLSRGWSSLLVLCEGDGRC